MQCHATRWGELPRHCTLRGKIAAELEPAVWFRIDCRACVTGLCDQVLTRSLTIVSSVPQWSVSLSAPRYWECMCSMFQPYPGQQQF
jgi:hypothetical protein